MYNRPINYDIQWGEKSNARPITPEKIKTGWLGNEKPMVEHMNWILNRIDHAIGYFMQGVRWGAEVEYPANEIVNHNGVFYKAKKTSKGFPVTNTEYWEPAFYSQSGGLSLADEINKIKNTDGYLSKYLKISAPVTTARMEAGSFQANVGLATSSSFNMGYSFDGYNTTGMYLNGTTLTMRVNGATKLSIPLADPSLTDRTTNVATTDWVQRLIDQKIGNIDMTANRLAVGSIFITVSEQNPQDLLGYGTWVRFAEGQVIVGRANGTWNPPWTKGVFNTFGAYEHQLTVDEMPKHTHSHGAPWNRFTGRASETGRETQGSGDYKNTTVEYTTGHMQQADWDKTVEKAVGGNQPHNNVQPSIVANIWRRTA